MTPAQAGQLDALRSCTFACASWEKRFVRDLVRRRLVDKEDPTLTERQAEALNRLAHSYRRQIGRCLAAEPCMWCAGAPVRRRA